MKRTAVILMFLVGVSLAQSNPPAVSTDRPEHSQNVLIAIYGGKAEWLADACKDGTRNHDSQSLSLCEAYIEGLMDGQAWTGYCGKGFAAKPCIPSDVNAEQMGRVIAKFGDDHPEKLHEKTFLFAAEALKSAFPCKDAGK